MKKMILMENSFNSYIMIDKDFELQMELNQKVKMKLPDGNWVYGYVLKKNPKTRIIKWEDKREPTTHYPETWKEIKIVS